MARHEIPSIPSMNELFDTKYDEFAKELEGAYSTDSRSSWS